jgi:hypothetical protein
MNICISIYDMKSFHSQNKRSKRGRSNSRREYVDTDERKFSSLWRVFANAPRHCAIEYMKEQMYAAGLELIQDKENVRHTVVNKRRNSRMSKLAYSCVGSIVSISGNTLNLVSYMPPSPVKLAQNNVANVTRNFSRYVVYPISDGTSIGLYYFGGQWIIRSLNGYDVGEYKWNGDRTYWDVFNEVMSTYENFSLDKLDKHKCYTIGIKHTAFHPFKEGDLNDIKRAWFIQSVDCAKVTKQNGSFDGAISRTDDIGIPIQRPIRDATMRSIMVDASNAYKNYKENETVFYGAILMSRHESVMITSDLYDSIISIFYTNNMNRNIYAGSYDRQKYMVLHTYLHVNRGLYEKFQRLFPQFGGTTIRFEKITNELVEAMIKNIEQKKKEQPDEEKKMEGRSLIFNNTVNSLLCQLSSHAGGLPKLGMNIARVLNRFVRSSTHIATLYDLMYYSGEPDMEELTSQLHEECSLQTPETDTST